MPMQAQARTSRAVQLLKRVMATRWYDPEVMASELAVTVGTLEGYLNETMAIPLDRQLCLSLFVIQNIPPLSRAGYQLRGQVQSAVNYQAREF